MSVRNATGVADIRCRPMWKTWSIKPVLCSKHTYGCVLLLFLALCPVSVAAGQGRGFSYHTQEQFEGAITSDTEGIPIFNLAKKYFVKVGVLIEGNMLKWPIIVSGDNIREIQHTDIRWWDHMRIDDLTDWTVSKITGDKGTLTDFQSFSGFFSRFRGLLSNLDGLIGFPHTDANEMKLDAKHYQLSESEKSHEPSDLYGFPFRHATEFKLRFFISMIFCGVGTGLIVWSMEKLNNKRRILSASLMLSGFLLICSAILLCLTFKPTPDLGWLL
jgi:hypothetical protein